MEGVPNSQGTCKGRKVPTQPNLKKTMYKGIIVTANGIIIVDRQRKKTTSRPSQLMRANPYATSALTKTEPKIRGTVISSVFNVYCKEWAGGQSGRVVAQDDRVGKPDGRHGERLSAGFQR